MGHFNENGKYCPNTVESIREACGECGWNGYSDSVPVCDAVLEYAERLQESGVLPSRFEMFPCADGSVQFEYPDDREEFDIFEIHRGEFVHSYKDGYRGFYDWADFINYVSSLKLKMLYIAKGK